MRNAAYAGKFRAVVVYGIALIALMMHNLPAEAEVKIIETDYTYSIGDNDSKLDARRIALQEAKREALEQAGTYLESRSEVKNYQLTRDEVKAYAAGVIETTVIADEMRGNADHPELHIKTRCTIDTAVMTAAIEQYRNNEDLKEQVKAAARENEKLKQERDALVKQLAARKSKKKADETRQKLDRVLTKEETNEVTDKVWASLVPALGDDDDLKRPEVSKEDLELSRSTLDRIVKANPGNQRALYLLASLYEKNGNLEAAEKQARAAIQSSPSNPIPHMKLGTLLHSQGRNQEALKEFHFVERLRPRDPMMLYYMGITLKHMGRCGPSIQYLQRFLKNPAAARRHAAKKQQAVQSIKDCGGARGGYQRRVRTP